LSIKELTEMVAEVVGFSGDIKWDADKPDGTPRKLMDVSKLHGRGWRHKTDLGAGLKMTYADFKENLNKYTI
jgi:GDP-L-fucose synthase